MDINELWAVAEPYIIAITGVGGISGSILFVLWAVNKLKTWFATNSIKTLLDGFASQIVGSDIGIELSAKTEARIDSIEVSLSKKISNNDDMVLKQNELLVAMADIVGRSMVASKEQTDALALKTDALRNSEPAPKKKMITAKLSNINLNEPKKEIPKNNKNVINMG